MGACASAPFAWTSRANGLALPGKLKTKRVVLVLFAGGVRTRETLGMPDNVPVLSQMATEGVTYDRARTSNLGHFGAALSIFTGISEARGIRENARGPDPTLFEYLRKDLQLPASDVWISTSGGVQQTNYSHSMHRDYGADFGANVLDGDGIFNREFREILASYGKPKQWADEERKLLAKLRSDLAGAEENKERAKAVATVERYVMEELTRGTADLRGINSGDAKALRVARNLLSIFRPRLLSVVLQQADVAHGSFNSYVEVIRKNDAALGELMQVVRGDPELADSTSVIVLPEFGRDRDLNSRRGLDHGDGSDDLNFVSIVCWGPDFRSGQSVTDAVRTIDVCPTVCELLGSKAGMARGQRLPRLFS